MMPDNAAGARFSARNIKDDLEGFRQGSDMVILNLKFYL